MKNNLRIICPVLIILCFAALAQAQVAAWYEGGPRIVFTSDTDPPGRKGKVLARIQTTDEKNLFSRVFIDTERNLYFGYDLVVEQTRSSAAAKQFKLTFKSLSVPAERVSASGEGQGNSKFTQLSLPKYPEPQIVQEGDTLVIDVLVNPQTGVKIVDLIKVVPANSPLPPTLSAGGASGNGNPSPPRDFTIDAVELKVSSSRLTVNGKAITGEAGNSQLSVTGALVWFYLPGRGRFILSLVPREGYNFQKAGTIQGNKIRFAVGGNHYEWVSAFPVVTATDDTWNLWVLEDKNYKPEIEPTREFPYLFGAADNAVNLLQKR